MFLNGVKRAHIKERELIMARMKRFTVENGIYHICSRGHNKQTIFRDDYDYSKYLNVLLDNKFEHNLKIYHYTIMPNHTHLIIESPTGIVLGKAMRNLNQKYAQYFRKKYGGVGYVWQDRFKSFLIQNGIYLLQCGRYIEVNPVKAGIVNKPEDYLWSSYKKYAINEENQIVDYNPEFIGLSENSELRIKKYADFVLDGIKDKRNLERYYNLGAYGDMEFINTLKSKGLKQVSWDKGRPSQWKE
jgi:putative transposase